MHVVSGHVPLWQVRFVIGSEASQRPDTTRYCSDESKDLVLNGQGRMGSDWPQRSVAFQMALMPSWSLDSGLCILSIQLWTTYALLVWNLRPVFTVL